MRRRTISLYCRREHCGGRMFLEDDYWEPRNFGDNKKIRKIELTCTLCARSSRCEYKEFKHLLDEIERVLRKQTSKNYKKPVLS